MNCLKIRLKITTISRRKEGNQGTVDLFHNVLPSTPLFES